MTSLRPVFQRLSQSAVVWSWVMNGLRLTSGLVVLPLLIRQLSGPDFGMYFVLLGLSALIPTLDFGFSVSIGRAVSYAMGGARELKAHNVATESASSGPNHALLWRLLNTTQQLYRWLTLATLGLLGAVGTMIVAVRVQDTSSPTLTWTAWGITLIAALWEIYAGWWNVFLRSMNRVTTSTQQVALAQAVKIALSCGLLLSGAGLLAVPLASLAASFLQRTLSRCAVLRLLEGEPSPLQTDEVRSMVNTLWPNTWRLGVYFLGGYLNGYAYSILAPTFFGLEAGATFSFTLQLVTISSSMAQVWTFVKWPVVGQLRVRQDRPALQRLLRPRLRLQMGTYGLLAGGLLFLGPQALAWLDSGKSLLPPFLFASLCFYGLLEMHCSFWNTLISTENRLPMVWPTLTSNAISLILALCLATCTQLGIAAFVVSPLLIGLAYNHWKWPREGARSIGTSWWRFMLS